jgi:predicted alpha/beta-fold hydrolase
VISADDPIIPAAHLSSLARSDRLSIVRTRYGGHCGFVDHWNGPSFADRYMLEQFEQIEYASGDAALRR